MPPKFDPIAVLMGIAVFVLRLYHKAPDLKTLRTSSERLSLSQTVLLLTGCETWSRS